MTLGLGRDGIARIPADDDYRMDVHALATAIAEDRAAGRLPIAIVATLGTHLLDVRRPGRRDRRRRGATRDSGSTSTPPTRARSR